MQLTDDQESILASEFGAGPALAMKTLVNYGQIFGAGRLVPVNSAHLAGTWGFGTLGTYFQILERMASEGTRVRVPTTIDPRPGHDLNIINRLIFRKQQRLENLLTSLGVMQNYSCVCYADANIPAYGDILAWSESSAVQYANSVLGARTNRNSIIIDLCSAITGYTPEFGYLLDRNRRGCVLVKLKVERMDAPGLGFILGQRVVDKVPVIEHYAFSPAELKNMGGAMASSGGVALFHVEGLTPEAPDLQTVFDGTPPETITVTQADLDGLREKNLAGVRTVVLGCPQMTYDEVMELGQYFAGRRVSRPTWFSMVPSHLERFRSTRLYSQLISAGVIIHTACPLTALATSFWRKPILTNSGKIFYYMPGTRYGTVQDCLWACGVLS